MFDRLRAIIADTTAVSHPEESLRIAITALLAEVARVDGQVAESERVRISDLLIRRFALEADDARHLFETGERAGRNSTHLYRFTRLLVQELTNEQRIEVIEMMWEIAYADGVLDPGERALISKIAGLLYVEDRDRSLSRRRVLERMGAAA